MNIHMTCYDNNNIQNLLMRFVILLAILFLVTCDQLVPLSKDGYGYSVGDPQGKLQIQFFLDFLCPDSKVSYNAWKNVLKTVDLVQKRVKLTYQIMPLQFHYYSFKIHQAFAYVHRTASADTTIKLMDYIFDKQDQFTEEVLLNYTLDNFLNELAALIASVTRVSEVTLRQELSSQSPSDFETRYHWKYSVGTHGVSGAPIFNANGVRIDGADDFGYGEWIQFLKNYTN